MKPFRSVIACLALFSPAAIAAKPNILILLVDDMWVMDTSVPFLADAQGDPEVHELNRFYHTPNMERLAKTGMRFEQFYANSVCSPSRVSLVTGQDSARHHTTQWIRPDANNAGKFGPSDWQWKGVTEDHETLPALLRKAGYRTIHVGKAHFGPDGSFGELPENFGFDVNIGGRAIGQPGSYYGTDNFGGKTKDSHAVKGLEDYHGKEIYLTEALTLEMKREIGEAVAADRPFFAYMSYYAVHAPFMPNKRYSARYEDAAMSPKAKDFATMIESVDTSTGDLLDHLDTLGVAENTLVIFLGDNGSDAPLGTDHEIATSAPLRGKKATHYEGGTRVPFIASWAKPGSEHAAQKKLPIVGDTLTREVGVITDIFPTVLDLAGVATQEPVDGKNLAPVLAGGSFDGGREFLMHFPHEHRSSYFTVFRKGDWKLICHYRKADAERWELFNLAEDRAESHNLAEKEPARRDRMIAAMAAALENAGAQYVRAEADSDGVLKPSVP